MTEIISTGWTLIYEGFFPKRKEEWMMVLTSALMVSLLI
jgi:hypothetical protein